MIKKILTITSIAVLTTFMMTMAMTNVAQAGNDEDGDDFNCKIHGSFFPPDLDTGIAFAGSSADCSVIGEAGLASVIAITDLDPEEIVDGDNVLEHCIALGSPDGLDSFLVNEKGFISFSTSGFQCFFDEDGPIDDADNIFFADNFCGAGEMILTSESTGTYDISDGLVDGNRVVGGSGETHSFVDHCAGDTAPFGNSGFSSFHGNIETIDDDDDDDDDDDEEEEDD